MTQVPHADTRTRLLDAAADLVASAPGEEISLRAVCDQVGVKMPTLYHFFGSKQGLLDAVVVRGFELYLAQKSAQESSGDPIQDLRVGWDTHVAFGVENPGFYTLMYGKVRPGQVSEGQSRASETLLALTRAAADQGRLIVPADQAAAHVLVTNIGVTLRQVVLATPDPQLSAAVRESTIAAITGTAQSGLPEDDRVGIHRVLEYAVARPDVLGEAETQLLTQWLRRLAAHP
ncbi:TetR/AcrR family transcriptional regulator [Calidifontibacter sp. DB0510]|uniref:TetR/AcrR family transcriptional regulator n=1 Tax=Metallococcus carri TaxID=1656884 RepID=A0A967E9V9_9MICO|nr:TetR/AcrR family transcriptional regulator [Metallococcus carri]NHN55620.1 TetR/AcrR family transcriptional regulator [Metallococcus carri]NOP38196.1 TetR/AcrR family transcriptional regulator [Calidifontibacter sp. DB2511S]